MERNTPDYAWVVADPLGEALHALRMTGTFYCRSELTAPWGVDLPAMPDCLMFHAVTSGHCHIEFPSGESHALGPGDFALIPHGRGHMIKDSPKSASINIFDLPRELLSPRYEILKTGGGGSPANVICGAVCLEDPSARKVVGQLPEIIIMDTATPEHEWLFNTIRLMVSEAHAMRPGGDTIITRVSDILVVQAIRHWLNSDPQANTGWLKALRDKRIGKAIALIHRFPSRPWTVESLAGNIGMSRSGFSARFAELVGESPMHYVRQWRFQVAANWLREESMPVAEVSDRLGYESEAAFSRAFKKATGQTPGALRKADSKA